MPSPLAASRVKLEKLMDDPRYWDPQHPEHGKVLLNVQRAFRAAYPEPPAEGVAGVVHVRGYTRRQDGKTIDVSDYNRSARQSTESVGGGMDTPISKVGDDNRPISAQAQGNQIVYVNPDGSRDVHEGGTLSWRANNPGNVADGLFARRHGAIGRVGNKAIFPTEEDGKRAQATLLGGPAYQARTIDSLIEKYAPPGENNTAAYQRYIRNSLGVEGTTRLRDLSSSQMNELIKHIIIFEGWKVGKSSHIERQNR